MKIEGAFGPYGQGKTDDKPSLHKRGGLYYLSWSSFYAVSENVYGPYRYRGTAIDPAHVSPKFRRDRINLHHDRHGNFFTFKGRWYYAANDFSQPGRTKHCRDVVMGYVHYRDNGDIAPVRIDETGVGRYDAAQGQIEAEDFFEAKGCEERECPVGGFELRIRDGGAAHYPNVCNVPAQAALAISLWGEADGVLEIREGSPDGRLLGTAPFRKGRPGYFKKCTATLSGASGTLDLWIAAKGAPCHIDWFEFTGGAPPQM